MKKAAAGLVLGLAMLVALALGGLNLMWQRQAPVRQGELALSGLSQPVSVRYDEWGVPHLKAANEPDLYRALGFVHAQDRLFQMELLRRLARGELAEILGPKLLPTDRLFRTLGLGARADAMAALPPSNPAATQALSAYLDGINQFQASRPLPLEFKLLGISPRPFTPADTLSVAGYLAYSFAAAFRSEPVLTHIRDQLGPAYLKVFDLDWHPRGVVPAAAGGVAGTASAAKDSAAALTASAWKDLGALARLSLAPMELAQLPQFEGSNAWAVSGRLTRSGKPLLAGDPHIAFSTPAVWYEAHLSAPGFELYGHFQALVPSALLGHNQAFGWSLTMFQNDDLDLIAETTDAEHPDQVRIQGRWVPLQTRQELIRVKGQEPETLTLRRSPHGPIINDALGTASATLKQPIAMWWTLLETDNPLLDAFHLLNRADTLDKARRAASLVHAPGLNIVWANAAGDIGWWAAARLPKRPAGANPAFILNGASAEADKLGWLPFSENPQEENPARGFIVSANHQPAGDTPVPGYYAPSHRAEQITVRLRAGAAAAGSASGAASSSAAGHWDTQNSQAVQLDTATPFPPRLLAALLPVLRPLVTDPAERELLATLAGWKADHPVDAVAPTLYNQLLYELVQGAMADEMGPDLFPLLLRQRQLDDAMVRLLADPASPWWGKRDSHDTHETRETIVAAAWRNTLAHLRQTLGPDPQTWTWGRAHTLTHVHPLGRVAPLDKVFNVGPLPAPGGREVPNNLAASLGPAPWAVTYGPSTRRLIDFATPTAALGSNPVGQSGIWGDQHYADQAAAHVQGRYRQEYLDAGDVRAHSVGELSLKPGP